MTKRIFFMHIPKTAGSSVNDWLESVFGREHCAFHLESRRDVFFELDTPRYAHIKVASGHFGIHETLGTLSRDWLVFTCLRNPVRHLISHLRWMKHVGSHDHLRLPAHPVVQELAAKLLPIPLSDIDRLKTFIAEEFEAKQFFDNCQTRYLLSRHDGMVTPSLAMQARANLDLFDAVFTVPQAPLALRSVLEMAGVEVGRLPAFPHSNAGIRADDADMGNPEVRDFYRSAVAYDAAVYVKAEEMGSELTSHLDYQEAGAEASLVSS